MSSSHKHSTTGKAAVAGTIDIDLTKAIAAHEAKYHAPIVTPPPVTPPSSGAPPIGPKPANALLWHDFSKDGMGPFRVLTYPNDHSYATDPSQLMRQYCKYVTDAAHINLTEGPYLTLRCTRNPAVANPAGTDAWLGAFVGTGLPTSPAPFSFQYGTVKAMAAMGTPGKGGWDTAMWPLIATSWSSPEIDWPEVIGGKLTANLHGSSADGQKVSLPFPGEGWHEYGIVKAPTYIAFLFDGVEVGRANVAMSATMALLADAKVGLSAPDATTPDQWVRLAWVKVTP